MLQRRGALHAGGAAPLREDEGREGGREAGRSRAADARFLMQATFGPTRESLAELGKMTYEQWVAQQLQLPVESHREYYRRRVNAHFDTRPEYLAEQRVALADTPCTKGSRWHSYAFTAADVGKPGAITISGTIKVEGAVRTHLRPPAASSRWMRLAGFPPGYVCHVGERKSTVTMSQFPHCGGHSMTLDNPPVWTPRSAPDMSAHLAPAKVKGVAILGSSPPGCALDAALGSGSVVVEAGARFYRYEPRLHLLSNEPSSPSTDTRACVQPSPVNEQSCRVQSVARGVTVQGLSVEVVSPQHPGKFISEGAGGATVARLVDAQVDHPISRSWPGLAWNVQGRFAARWTGDLLVSQGGDYDFYLESDTGSQLRIDSALVVDNGGQHNMLEKAGSATLSAGSHAIEIELFVEGPGIGLVLRWRGPDSRGRTEPVPSSALSTSGAGELKAECPVSCGSPGEVASDPAEGHQWPMWMARQVNARGSTLPDKLLDNRYTWTASPGTAKSTVWTMQALAAKDQLRQRMAWALSQIFVASAAGTGYSKYSEMWVSYYDIFVRHAFGNFRDVLRAVTFSPAMGSYLTHAGSASFDHSFAMPNENYAREVMQLFTIGLELLNKDGSQRLDANGEAIGTYTNENIMSFARVFTGFVYQPMRSNVEYMENRIDPMVLDVGMHDVYPKLDLSGGFIGDGHPLCSERPQPGSFLAEGAKYVYHDAGGAAPSGALVLASGSALAAALCGPEGRCGSLYAVTLPAALECSGDECSSGPPGLVRAGDAYYEYVPPPCVHLYFGEPSPKAARQAPAAQQGFCIRPGSHGPAGCHALDSLDGGGEQRQQECLAKCRAVGARGCGLVWGPKWYRGCYAITEFGPLVGSGAPTELCWDFGETGQEGHAYLKGVSGEAACPKGAEVASMAECREALRRLGLAERFPVRVATQPSDAGYYPAGCSWFSHGQMSWSLLPSGTGHAHMTPICRTYITVDAQGAYVPNRAENAVAVPWLDAAPAEGVHPVTVEMRPVFGAVPGSKADARARLSVGAHPPAGGCGVCDGEVRAYLGPGGAVGADTVFEVDGRFFRNVESVLVLPGGKRAFRNPPVFLRSTTEQGAQARVAAEVEATLDHLFGHSNTPIFISKRLIQRFGTSNPSKAYMEAVVDAFTSGAYGGVTYSGRYGDLAATVAAVVLHPDASSRSAEAASAASNGALREPFLKLIHLMRSMEYKDVSDSQVAFSDLSNVIGQFPYEAPTVFNYYKADFELPGRPPASTPEPEPEPEPEPRHPLAGPEFQILTPPFFVRYLNSLSSLIKRGVSERCGGSTHGVGTQGREGTGPIAGAVCPQGRLEWPGGAAASETLEELDVLLTGGRLTPVAKAVVRGAYQKAAPGSELQAAQQAITMTAEFNTLGAPLPRPGARPPPPPELPPSKKPYKAFVLLFLAGGVDSWNMLVPQRCGLYQEYRDARTELSLDPGEVVEVTSRSQSQKCGSFGVHAGLGVLKDLYDKGEAAFVTNVGNLAEPTTLKSMRSGATRCFNLFSHSDQQIGAQTLKCQDAGTSSHGAGGRVADALARDFRTTSFSLSGSAVWAAGAQTEREILDERGSEPFAEYGEWKEAIGNITAQLHGNVYADAYGEAFRGSIELTEKLSRVMASTHLKTNFAQDNILSRKFAQAAKLIAARESRSAERDFFFIEIGGWDTHSRMKKILNQGFAYMDAALRSFVAEMEAQNVWDSVVLASASEFGRTLDSNGGGSDHAWAGQSFVMSGDLRGKEIFNTFPATFKAENPRNLGRGRLIPEYPWESVLVPVAEWLGLQAKDRSHAFPNLVHFNSSHLIPRGELFKS